MVILYLLLMAATYGCGCAFYDLYQVLRFGGNNVRIWDDDDWDDFWSPEDGTRVRSPKTPFPGGDGAEAIDGSSFSSIP